METVKTSAHPLGGCYEKWWGKKDKKQKKNTGSRVHEAFGVENFLLLTQSLHSLFLVQDW